ncbi:FAD-dependent monooxygenase [Rhodococcus sp. IEGM1428]|uniref:FAD-dependent monooxygenase n=1 Tax=Rhodococcus sp. IEGM1428 TaxID=3392191 RepID=UPI003D0E4DCA
MSRVLVVGAGPTGLVTALSLARSGIGVDIVDTAPGIGEGSRALGLSRRTLQILGSLGTVGDRCMQEGLPWRGSRSFYRDTEVMTLPLEDDGTEAFPAMLNLAQHRVAQLLVDELGSVADNPVTVQWSTTVESIDTSDNGPVLVRTRNGSRSSTGHWDWVIGCDGPRSTVRREMGLELEGESFDSRFVIVDVRFPSRHPAERRAWFDPPSNPGSTVLMHRQPDDVWRLDYQLDSGAITSDTDITTKVSEHLHFIGERGDTELVWSSSYQARALTAPTYRSGRLLLAGDAAHLIPIFGIRGMNSAIEDAHNLAWKLAHVITADGPDTLLDTYSTERVAAARENIRLATRSARFMAPPSTAHRDVRDALLQLVAAGHTVWSSVINPRQTSMVGYVDSPLTATGAFTGRGPQPGEVYTDGPISTRDGTSHFLSDRLGRTPTLLCFEPDVTLAKTITDILNDIVGPGPLRALAVETATSPSRNTSVMIAFDPSGKTRSKWDSHPGDVHLIRPDGHLAGSWNNPTRSTLAQAVSHLRTAAV